MSTTWSSSGDNRCLIAFHFPSSLQSLNSWQWTRKATNPPPAYKPGYTRSEIYLLNGFCMKGRLKVSTLQRCLHTEYWRVSKHPALALVVCQIWSWRSSDLLNSGILSINAVAAEEVPVGQTAEAGEAHVISCLVSSTATASTGWTFPLTQWGILFSCSGRMTPTLHTQVFMDLAQKRFTFHIKPVPSALYSMPRSHARCFLSLFQHCLWRESALLAVWEFCVNWNIDQRQRIESREFQTVFLALFTSSGSQPLTFCLPMLTHSHSTNPSAALFQGCWKTEGSFSWLEWYRDIDET